MHLTTGPLRQYKLQQNTVLTEWSSFWMFREQVIGEHMLSEHFS